MSDAIRTIKETQTYLKLLGFDPNGIDGVWGKVSQGAYDRLLSSQINPKRKYGINTLPWGSKLTQAEISKVFDVIVNLKLEPRMMMDLMGCMAWETGETFSPSVKNSGSSATGLIQFMASTAKGLGTTTDKLAKMSVIEQLDYVEKYFKPYAKRIKNLGDFYMAIIWPAAIGKDDSHVMWMKINDAGIYKANGGLDINNDGMITRSECLHKVRNKMVKGFLPKYAVTFSN